LLREHGAADRRAPEALAGLFADGASSDRLLKMTARTTLAALALAAAVPLAGFASGTALAKDPVMTIVPASGSQIEITNATLVPSSVVSSECVSFVNHAPQAVKRIVFVFTKLDQNGVAFGKDTFDRRGTFDPNGVVEGMRSGRDVFSRSRVANCHDTDLSRRTPDTIRVEITTVEYADGTTWTGPLAPTATPPPATPTPEPTLAPAESPSPAPSYSP
jgi:hypothetical protein